MKYDSEMRNRVVAAVKCIESVSSLEVVVTLSPRTVPATVPVLASAFGACIIILTVYPMVYSAATPLTFAINILFFSAVVLLLTGTLPPLQRLFLSDRFLKDAAMVAARAEFVRQGVHCTCRRTGLLLYLSVFERQAVLIADVGVKAMIPAYDLDELEREAESIFGAKDQDARLAVFFEHLRQVAGRFMPKEADDINELDDDLRSS